MLLFSNAGLYAFVLGAKRGKRGYIWLASVLFGLAMLNKLFGALPLAGCFLYLLYAWVRERRGFREVLREGLALGVPALLLVGGVAVVFMRITPYFLTAVFEHHVMQEAELSRWQAIVKALEMYRIYVMSQPVAMGLVALGGIAVLRRGKALETLALWQMPTALVFLTFTRTLMLRHMTYLSPAMTTLAAVALWSLLCGDWRVWEPGAGLGGQGGPALGLGCSNPGRKPGGRVPLGCG
jgi:4-amino-4-deoxy-L-arabinose transferase-like glycosyltransferase